MWTAIILAGQRPGADPLLQQRDLQLQRLVAPGEEGQRLLGGAVLGCEAQPGGVGLDDAGVGDEGHAGVRGCVDGGRVLGVAACTVDGPLPEDPDAAPFRFEGLIGFLDPVRPDVPAALATGRQLRGQRVVGQGAAC